MPHLTIGDKSIIGGHHDIWYETRGRAESNDKILFVMGLLTDGLAWNIQADYFSSIGYHVVIYDNRGIGQSTFPTNERCTTQRMAYDALALVDHLQWSEFHVCGVSMGGMIAEELALIASHRIVSLSLIVTHAGGRTARAPLKGGLYLIKSLLYVKSHHEMALAVMKTLYSKKTLSDPSSDNYKRLYKMHRDRILVRRKPKLAGALGHVQAVFTHYLNYTQILQIRYSPFPTLVMCGTEDTLVNPANSKILADALGSEYHVIQDAAHGLLAEKPEVANSILKSFFERASSLRQSLTSNDVLRTQWKDHWNALSLACNHRPHCTTKAVKEFLQGYVAGFMFRLIFHHYIPPAIKEGQNQPMTRIQQSNSFALIVGSIRSLSSSAACIYRNYLYRQGVLKIAEKYNKSRAPADTEDSPNTTVDSKDMKGQLEEINKRCQWPPSAFPRISRLQIFLTLVEIYLLVKNIRYLFPKTR